MSVTYVLIPADIDQPIEESPPEPELTRYHEILVVNGVSFLSTGIGGVNRRATHLVDSLNYGFVSQGQRMTGDVLAMVDEGDARRFTRMIVSDVKELDSAGQSDVYQKGL